MQDKVPDSIESRFEGAALAFQASLSHSLWLVLAAVVTMYIVLGVLYESYIHPVTILSTLPSAALGALLALWSAQASPDTTLSFDIMVDILLMVVIGGMGTMYGAVVGAVLLVLAQNYLQALLGDRWLLWLGVAFILCVYFFPTGIVGRLRKR